MADEIIYNIKVEGAESATANLGRIEGLLKRINQERTELIKKQAAGNSLSDEEKNRLAALTARQASLNQSKKEATHIVNTQARANQTLTSAYQQLQIQLTQNRNKYRDLAVQNKQNTAEGRALLKTIQQQDATLKRVDASMGQHQRNVGNYSSALNGLKSGFTKLIGVLGIAGGLAGALKLVNSIFNATNSAGDKLAVMFGGLKTGASVFMKALSSGDFSNFLTNMTEAIRVGREYIKVLDDVADSNLSLSINEAESRIEIAAKMKILRDVTVAEKDRIAAADRILEIERINSEKRIANNKRVLDAELDLASTVNNANREQLFDLLKNYDARKNQIQQAEALIEAEDNLNATRREFSDPYADAATVDAAYKAMRNYENVINSADDELKAFTENYRGYLKLTDEERNKIGDAAKKYFESQAAFDEQTSRAATQRSTLLALAQKNDLKSVTDYDEIEKERRKAIEQAYVDFAKQAEEDLHIATIDLKDKAEKIDEEYLDREIKRRTESTANYIKQLGDEFLLLKLKEQREEEYNDRIKEIYHDTAAFVGDQFGNMLTNTEANFKDFSKNMLYIMLDSLEKALFVYLAKFTAEELSTKGFPFGLASTAVGTGIITAAFAAARGAVSSFAKGGIIGGNLHSSGGTQFYGSDGSRFEAERGELLTIVNRHDTERLSALSAINSKHGRAFYASGGIHVPGAIAANGIDRAMLREIVNETVRGIGAIPVVVSENDITTAQKSARIVKTKGDY